MSSAGRKSDKVKVVESRIVVFDSGVGGLTIWQAIKARCPGLTCDYLLDNAYFPYGELPESVLIERVCQLLLPQIAQHPPRLIVIACNTASTLVLERIRAETSIPVVGVVPAIKPAALLSKSRQIGLLATPGTIGRSYTQRLIDEFAPDCEVVKIGDPELVHMAEAELAGEGVDLQRLAAILAPFQPPLDCVILGCTHYPFLTAQIKQLLPDGIQLIDTGEAIANRVASLLACPQTHSFTPNRPSTLGYTKHSHRISKQIKRIRAMGFQRIGMLETTKRP